MKKKKDLLGLFVVPVFLVVCFSDSAEFLISDVTAVFRDEGHVHSVSGLSG